MAGPRTPVADANRVLDSLADSGGDFDPPISPFEAAKLMGVDVFLEPMASGHSGYLEWNGTRAAIVINEEHSYTRQRFTCAHELGHFVDQTNRNTREPADRDWRSSQGTSPSEVYANKFAAALLMPRDLVEKYQRILQDEDSLARKFRVSPDAMRWRLVNLGLAR